MVRLFFIIIFQKSVTFVCGACLYIRRHHGLSKNEGEEEHDGSGIAGTHGQ